MSYVLVLIGSLGKRIDSLVFKEFHDLHVGSSLISNISADVKTLSSSRNNPSVLINIRHEDRNCCMVFGAQDFGSG